MLPGVLERPGGEQDAIAYLESNPVRLVVTDDRDWPAYGRGAFGEGFGLASPPGSKTTTSGSRR